jgi:hypothetical protein
MEKIQFRTLKFIYDDTDSTYEELLTKSKLPTLKIRRIRTIDSGMLDNCTHLLVVCVVHSAVGSLLNITFGAISVKKLAMMTYLTHS